MREKYLMTTEKRIEMYGERLKKIRDELAKRDLSDIPTNKLFEMMAQCEMMLEKEIPSVKFKTIEEMEMEKKFRIAKEIQQKHLKELDYELIDPNDNETMEDDGEIEEDISK